MENRTYAVGAHVVYHDEFGRPRDAIVTAWWHASPHYSPVTPEPGANLVFASDDDAKHDPYGRQIERETSVVHRTNQPAPGKFWRWPDEESTP